MNPGQLLGGAGVVGRSWREAENAERVARQNQLAIEEQNRVADLKQQLAGLQMPSFQPVDVAQFTQPFMPGQAMPMGEVAPVAPDAAPAVPAARTAAPAAPAAPAVPARPPAGLQMPANAGDIQRQLSQAQIRLGQLKGPWYLPTPEGNRRQIAETEQEIARLQEVVRTQIIPAARAEYQRVNPQYTPSKPYPGEVPAGRVATGTVTVAGATRSDRNNNPGNLIYNEYTKGLGATGQDKDGFAIFPSPEVGQAASLSLLQNYGRQGRNTVESIINKWSPPNAKGNTPAGVQNYVNFVSQRLGVDPKQPLNMNDTATLQALNAAIRQFEGTGTGSAATPGAPAAVAPVPTPAPMEVPRTQARNMEMAEFYLANPESIPFEAQQINQMAQQQAALLTRQRNEAAQLAQVYMRSGTAQGIEAAMRLRDNIGQIDASLLQIQQQVAQKQTYLQGMQGLRELATANDPRRLAGVLSQYMGAPVGIQPRPDGNYNYFVNGKKVQDGVSPAQLAAMALKEFSPEARQASAASAALENELALKRKYGDAMVNAMRDIQKAIIDGEYKVAEERAKQAQGKLTIDTSKGVAYFQQGNRVFVINPDGKVEETPLGKVELPPTARPVAGLNMGR